MLSIATTKEWWKRNETDIIIAVAFMLLAFFAFLVGRISSQAGEKEPIVIRVPDSVLQKQAEMDKIDLTELAFPKSPQNAAAPSHLSSISTAEQKGQYVASRNGTYYFAANSLMAARIKPQNRVWFQSPQDAETKGYKPSRDLAQ